MKSYFDVFVYEYIYYFHFIDINIEMQIKVGNDLLLNIMGKFRICM